MPWKDAKWPVPARVNREPSIALRLLSDGNRKSSKGLSPSDHVVMLCSIVPTSTLLLNIASMVSNPLDILFLLSRVSRVIHAEFANGQHSLSLVITISTHPSSVAI